MIKKEYMKPTMQVVLLQQQSPLLAGSPGAKSLTGTEDFELIKDLDEDDV